jgi:hypothetical protein
VRILWRLWPSCPARGLRQSELSRPATSEIRTSRSADGRVKLFRGEGQDGGAVPTFDKATEVRLAVRKAIAFNSPVVFALADVDVEIRER